MFSIASGNFNVWSVFSILVRAHCLAYNCIIYSFGLNLQLFFLLFSPWFEVNISPESKIDWKICLLASENGEMWPWIEMILHSHIHCKVSSGKTILGLLRLREVGLGQRNRSVRSPIQLFNGKEKKKKKRDRKFHSSIFHEN